jgi:polyisoprenoid-binding protein YceI
MKVRLYSVAIGAALALNSSLIAADTYTIDPAHTRVGFSARHFGISNVKGRFKEFTGTLVLEGDELKEATATIQAQSIDTGVPKRDAYLRTPDFFDATNYPTITFKKLSDDHIQNKEGAKGWRPPSPDRQFHDAGCHEGDLFAPDPEQTRQRQLGRNARWA